MLQTIYMDTDPSVLLDRIVRACADSPYSIAELREILFREVLPACRSNLLWFVGGEWAGYPTDWLTPRIMRKHRHGKRPVLFGYLSTLIWWKRLEPKIRAYRAAPQRP
jgi:hypothetical protein